VSAILVAWQVTHGGSKVFPPAGPLERFYDAQATSLLHGRIDVPPEGIGSEAFIHNGKSYGYFGPTPALARLPLNLLFPGLEERWNRLSMISASVLIIWMLVLLLRRLEELLPVNQGSQLRDMLGAALILAVAIGSTNFPLSAEAKVYEEAIAWGSVLTLTSTVCMISYLMRPSRVWLVLGCSTAFFAFFARVSSGAGAISALAVMDVALLMPMPWLKRFLRIDGLPNPREAILAFSVTVALTVALWCGLNYWKFGNPFVSLPVKMAISYRPGPESPESLFSFSNLPATVWAYGSPSNIRFVRRFPWVDFAHVERTYVAAKFPGSHIGRIEPFASLSGTMPELLLAALAGTILCLGKFRKEFALIRAPLIGVLISSCLLFTWGLITYRYLHDMVPWLALGSAIAIAWITTVKSKRIRLAAASVFIFGVTYSVCVNFWLGILQDRYYAASTEPDRRYAFLDLGSDIDNMGLWRSIKLDTTHWRGYIPGESLEGGNLVADFKFSNRPDERIAHSDGPGPNAGEYAIDLPGNGLYHFAIRYASRDSRPVQVSFNGVAVGHACGEPTGGDAAPYQTWCGVGRFRLPGGRLHVSLLSIGEFPNISALRFVQFE
jgi:hypothetical protein